MTCSVKREACSQFTTHHSQFTSLFRSQTFYRITNPRLDCLQSNSEQGDGQSKNTRGGKNDPAYVDAVSEILKPFIHEIPGKRCGDKQCYCYKLQEIF